MDTRSPSKSSCVHFCRKRNLHPDPFIHIRNFQIPVVNEVRFLGVIFDCKLTFLPHVLYLRKKCERSLFILKVLSNILWGDDRVSLLRVYQALILSRLDYGCVVYGSARASVLKRLDTVHHSALRICPGAFRISPVTSLYVSIDTPTVIEILLLRKLERKGFDIIFSWVPGHVGILSNEQADNAARSMSDSMQRPVCYRDLKTSTQNYIHRVWQETWDQQILNKLHNIHPSTSHWAALPVRRHDVRLTRLRIGHTRFTHRHLLLVFGAVWPKLALAPLNPTFTSLHFFVVIFDSKLTFLPHVLYLRKKCERSLNILKVLSNTLWEADRVSLLRVYQALILSRLDYGCVVYGSARASVLKSLDTVHHSALVPSELRMLPACTCIDTPTVIEILLLRKLERKGFDIIFSWVPGHVGILSNEQADNAARSMSDSMQRPVCYRDLKTSTQNYVHGVWQETWDQQILNKLHNIHPSTSHWAALPMRRHDVRLTRLRIGHTCFTHRHLLLGYLNFGFTVSEVKGEEKPMCVICSKILAADSMKPNKLERHFETLHGYTDGSKTVGHVGCSVVFNNTILSFSLHNSMSVFSAELTAILVALQHILISNHRHFCVYTDSMSALESLHFLTEHRHPTVIEILILLRKLERRGFDIIFSWVPGHVGILGNEQADNAARSMSDSMQWPVCYRDLKTSTQNYVHGVWQDTWDQQILNKLHNIHPSTSHWAALPMRRHDVRLTRLRIGHTRFTHRHLLLVWPKLALAPLNPTFTSLHFFVVIFDSKLTFLPHVLYLRKKCERSLNILKVLSNTLWEADRVSLLRVYQALILSRLDYGCVVYGSARASVLKSLDTVHHSALVPSELRMLPACTWYAINHL
ncbi:putative RNA-directed DNA polymerase from transposon X-element [Trichonephila clavipes]|nr:putative RNA-directed DNA polymerase from transposon X-element [Trichonephila clavipes]